MTSNQLTTDVEPDAAVQPSSTGTLAKAPTGIGGFDEITGGGLPRERATLVVGGPGAGKTVFALEALVNGAREHAEPGIFVALEENSREIVANAATFGWNLPELERQQLFFLDAKLSPVVVTAGDFDLSAMLSALEKRAHEMGAKRIVFDGLDVLLTLLDDPGAQRREVYRLHDWLRNSGLTGIITAKASDRENPTADRYSFMQFMVDAVVVLQHRLAERVSLRALRVVKYRGSSFAEGEFPLVISPTGIEVSTFGHTELVYDASTERVSTGIGRLDTMLDGGYYRGSGVLISGAPGTAKTTLAGAFVDAACKRGERALYVSFDESASQIQRNLRSVGIDLEPHVRSGLLDMYSIRTEARSAEGHLIDLKCRLESSRPQHLVLDPISALAKTGGQVSAVHTSLRLLDLAKANGITVLSTSLVASDDAMTESTSMQISTIADSWLHLSYLVHGGERNRALTIVKSRGMKHSNQVRELLLSDRGLNLAEVYTAGGEVLVGTARWEKEAEVREAERRARAEAKQRRAELEVSQADIQSRIEVLQRQLEANRAAGEILDSAEMARERRRHEDEVAVGKLRGADTRLAAASPSADVPRPRDRGRAGGDD